MLEPMALRMPGTLAHTSPTSPRSSPRLSLSPRPQEPTPPGFVQPKDLGSDAFSVSDVEKKRAASRRLAAKSIEPGCDQWVLTNWKPKETKPTCMASVEPLSLKISTNFAFN